MLKNQSKLEAYLKTKASQLLFKTEINQTINFKRHLFLKWILGNVASQEPFESWAVAET